MKSVASIPSYSFDSNSYLSNEQNPICLGFFFWIILHSYMGTTTHHYKDHHKTTNMESKQFFFGGSFVHPKPAAISPLPLFLGYV